MKNFEMINLNRGLLETDFNNVVNGKFQYAIFRNLDKLSKIVESFNKAIESCKSLEIQQLINEIKPIVDKAIKGQSATSTEDINKIEQECLLKWEKLDEWNKAWLETNKLINDLSNAESDFEPYKINLDLIESLGLNSKQMSVIYPLINE